MTEASNQPAPASSPTPEEQAKLEFQRDKDKQRMDYQLELDKQRMAIQYGYKKWELGWDKGIFALVLAAVGAAGIYWGNKNLDDRRTEAMKKMEVDRAESGKALEKDRADNAKAMEKSKQEEARKLEEFRTKEAGRRSLLEKQLPELFTINSAISDVTRVYFAHSGGQKAPDEQKVQNEYKAALAKAREAINRSTFLFDLDFNKDLDRYYAVHSKMSKLPTEKWGKYQEFAFDLSNKFDDLCKSVVEGQRGDPHERMHMPLSPISPSERERVSPEECVEAYFKHWQNEQKRH